MLSRVALFSMILTGSIAAQVQLQFPSGIVGTGYTSVVSLANGDRLLVGTGSTTSIFGTPRQAIALGAVGTAPYGYGAALGGNGDDQPAAAAVDPQGNIWIVDSTNSDDFILVNPVISQKVPYRTAGFVIEMDPTGSQLLFATYLCGHQPGDVYSAGLLTSHANRIAFDAAGNAYVAGETDEPDFGGGGVDSFGETFFYAFIVEISPSGKLIYSTRLGGAFGDCSGGSSCIGKESTYTSVNGMAVDASGNLTVSGVTNSSCGGDYPYGSGFVSRGSPDASAGWWTCVGFLGATLYLDMAVDPQGNVDLFGEYAPYTGVLESIASTGVPGLFAAKLSSDGSKLLYSTDLGQSPDANAHGIALDSAGNAYLTGTSSSAQFPSLAGVPNLGADFVLRLDPSGSQAQTLIRLPAGTIGGPPAFDGSGNLLLVSGQSAVLQLRAESAVSTPGVFGFANAASFAVNRGLYPGVLLSLFGFSLAPAAQSAVPDASGKFPTELGGVQVLMNSTAAPLLYVGPNQINLQVPFEIGQSQLYSPPIQVQVILPSGTLEMQFAESQSLGLFTSGGGPYAAALNQDGTVNSAANPAAPGSIVTLFGTGASPWGSGFTDGALASAATPSSQEMYQIGALVNETWTNILYAGAAPGLIDGVFQLNVQLPIWVTNPVLLTLSAAAAIPGLSIKSNPVQIHVQ